MKSMSGLLLLFLFANPCFARDRWLLDPINDPYFNFNFGISAFDGILGFEYQDGHHSFGVGLPGHVSYRYYSDPYQDSKFWGVYVGAYSIEDDPDLVDGVVYRDFESRFIGIGYGKRWQWRSGWNTTAGIGLEFYNDEFSNPGSTLKKTRSGVFPIPILSVGYKF